MVAYNTMGSRSGAMFQDKVAMWVYEEMHEVRDGGVLLLVQVISQCAVCICDVLIQP